MHNEHCLPTGGMVFFQYTPFDTVWDVAVSQRPYMFTELCSIAHVFMSKGGKVVVLALFESGLS